MLEPPIALGLAGRVLEVVKASHLIASAAQQLRVTNDNGYVNNLRTGVRDAHSSVKLITSTITDDIIHSVAFEEHKTITTTCLQCRHTGHAISNHLDDVASYLTAQHRNPFQGVSRECSTVTKAEFKPELVEEYEENLHCLVQVLSFHITSALGRTTTALFAATSLKQETLQSGLRTILRLLKDGGANITKSDLAEDGPAQECMSIATQARLDTLHYIAEEPRSQALAQTVVRRRTILSLLNFRQMSDRIDEVEHAFKSTLEWVFRDSGYKLAWSSFPDFLESEADLPYWVNGKAGSGKSTLLRFLIRHCKSFQHLRNWSGTRHLSTAHFFAWNLGTELQKTRCGMLQSLIYQVLVQDESWIHQVFPDLWHDIDPSEPKRLEPLSLTEAKRAFSKLVAISNFKRCFCFFVDGVDEFAEDVSNVVDLLLELKATNLKFVLSSRPIDECLDKFANCPQLRLQDLTAGDIRTYIDGRLTSAPVMRDLMHEAPQAAHELVTELEERASGVFLWVKLVVASLLNGLRRGDDIDDLKTRLRALPPDLSKLFASMLSKMEPAYQNQAAKLFRLVRTASMLLDGQSMPTQFLAVAHHDFTYVLNQKPVAFETQKIVRWCKVLQRQLVSRCCGLVEISPSTYRPDWWRADLEKLKKEDEDLLASHVQFLHRTVAEYLFQEDVWNGIVSKASEKSRFNPYENLGSAALHMMKISPLADDLPSMQAYAWAQVVVRSIREFERTEHSTLESLIDEMDAVLRHHNPAPTPWMSQIEVHSARRVTISHLTVLQRPLSNFLSFLAFVCLPGCLDLKLEQNGFVLGNTTAQKVMLQTLFGRSNEWRKISFMDRVETVCCLLEHGANPNETFDGPSFWQCCLQQVSSLVCKATTSQSQNSRYRRQARRRVASLNREQTFQCTCDPEYCKEWCELIVACIRAGAKVADIDYLANFALATTEKSPCCYAQLCQLLFRVKQEIHYPPVFRSKALAVASKIDIPKEPNEKSTYGSSSISGSATAHLGDEYTYGDKVTYVNHFYGGETRVDHTNRSSSACLQAPGQIVTPIAQADVCEILAQFSSDIINTLSTPTTTLTAPDKRELTEKEQDLVRRWHWRADGDARTFEDRQCSNTTCSTNTTWGWEYVPDLKGLLCLDCFDHWEKTGQLRTEERARDLRLTGEELFDQTFGENLQTVITHDSDKSDDGHAHVDGISAISKSSVQPSLVYTDVPKTLSTSQSIAVAIRKPTSVLLQDETCITSGTPHYLKNYKPYCESQLGPQKGSYRESALDDCF